MVGFDQDNEKLAEVVEDLVSTIKDYDAVAQPLQKKRKQGLESTPSAKPKAKAKGKR